MKSEALAPAQGQADLKSAVELAALRTRVSAGDHGGLAYISHMRSLRHYR